MCYFLILLYHFGHTEAEVWMVSGTSKQKKCYPVHTIALKLDKNILAKILGFHPLTGCDTTSSFSRIGKTRGPEVWKRSPDLLDNVKIGQDQQAYYLNIFCFTMYGHGGHFGQVTKKQILYLYCFIYKILHMKFELKQPNDF